MSTFNEADHPRGHHSNAGAFSEKTQSQPEVAIASSGQRTVLNSDLTAGDTLIGDNGTGRLTVIDVNPSSSMPGFMAVETNFGFLYLDSAGESTLAAEGEQHFEFTRETMTENDFSKVWWAAQDRFDYTGVIWSHEDIDSHIVGLIEQGEAPDNIDRDAVVEMVRDSGTWKSLSDAGSGNEDLYEAVTSAIRTIANR